MTDVETKRGPRPIVAVIGGAVSGSEAANKLAQRGAEVVVIEQNARPYGKIEDGLPRWHEKLREQEYEKVDGNLSREGVRFLPKTRLGEHVRLDELVALGFSSVVLANGAWRDRSLGLPDAEAYVGRGLAYQNPFVYWYNHLGDPTYAGPSFAIPGEVLVVGGGLASVDVAKIVNLTLARRALASRGIDVDDIALETAGIPETLAKHGLTSGDLEGPGATLLYRRRKQDMPLATPSSDDPKALAKAETARVKIMERVERKYLVRFRGLASPLAPLVEGDRMVGLRCVENEVDGRSVRAKSGSEFEIRAPLVVSSIGSIPVALPGVPMRGELYDFEDETTGRLRGHDRVFGLGNVLTGKGNIRDSRENAVLVSEHIATNYLGVTDGERDEILGEPRIREELLDAATCRERWVDEAGARRIADFVAAHHARIGYAGGYAGWMAAHR